MIIKELRQFYQIVKPGKPIIAIDYGEKKCGIAFSNQELTMAMPLTLINCIKLKEKIDLIAQLIYKYDASALVIGLPVNMDGSFSAQSDITLKFAANLAKNIDLPIYLQDERLTTKAANNLLKSIGINRKKRSKKDDALAASLILETVLDSRKHHD